jgi:alkylhydroperoxidase/carboxymuconolactone decarboxylase family protein YurZ
MKGLAHVQLSEVGFGKLIVKTSAAVNTGESQGSVTEWPPSRNKPFIRKKEQSNLSKPSNAAQKQKLIGDFSPKLVELTDRVLFDDVWERKELSKRDRSLVTVAALIALHRPDQLRFSSELCCREWSKERKN